MREAISLAPNNAQVKAAFACVQSHDSTHALLQLCRRFVQNNDAHSSKEIIQYLSSDGTQIPSDVTEECFLLVLEGKSSDDSLRDDIVGTFLQQSHSIRVYLAGRLHESVTTVFQEIFNVGDGSTNGLLGVVLDKTAWPDERARETCEGDVLQLLIAKLMESGHDHDGRAMKGISRLLSVDAAKLEHLLDEESFDAVLTALDIRWPQELRSQATLAAAKYLEVSGEKGHGYLSRFITGRFAQGTNNSLIIAFSAAACVFPVVPSIAASLFLIEGFLPSLEALLEKGPHSKQVEEAALDLLNAACIDGACREAIAKHCVSWLRLVAKVGCDQKRGQAAVVLAKTRSGGNANPVSDQTRTLDNNLTDLEQTFRKLLLDGTEADKKNAIEGLAFASIQAEMKEHIAKDRDVLMKLMSRSNTKFVKDVSETSPTVIRRSWSSTEIFGSLTIIENLTRYLPNVSDEQKRMSQLRAYANASQESLKPDLLDEDSQVTRRCKALLHAEAMPYLTRMKDQNTPPGLTPAAISLMSKIILSFSRTPAFRGIIAQQGAIPLLLYAYQNPTADALCRQTASHALARVLISIDPKLIRNHTNSAVPALLFLLEDNTEGMSETPRDMLPTFEALLAITNLASDSSLKAGTEIVKAAFSRIEDLLLSSNSMIQRAATELVCNLMAYPSGIEKFADGSKAAGRRLHVLIALADAEDTRTRRAAGGALAMITEFETCITAILDRERGLDVLLGLCQDDDAGCVHRGVVCIQNIVLTDGDVGKRAVEAVKAVHGVDVLKGVLRASKDMAVVQSGVEALKVLVG